MVLQVSGPIRLSDIGAEFGDTAPHSLSEFYGATASVVTSGPISLGGFYGLANFTPLTYTISNHTANVEIDNASLLLAGWDGLGPVTIEVPAGIYVYSDSTALPGMTISGVYPNGITLVVDGYIIGMGGNGAGGASVQVNATAGGPALSISCDCTITGSGYIAGGGGGGGNYRYYASSTTYTYYTGGGGAGGGNNPVSQFDPLPAVGTVGADYNRGYGGGAGGGGA